MSSALDRLAEIVRMAESKSRAQKLGAEIRHASERLQAAEQRMRQVERRVVEVRPARLKDLAKTEADEVVLKELIKKLAHTLAGLDAAHQEAAEREITAARQEIAELRQTAQAELEAMQKESEQARQELRIARDQYHHLRREIDQILPEHADELATHDRLYRETEVFFPEGQIQSLAREIDDGERHYAVLDAREQFAQLKIWIGRFRRLQALAEDETSGLGEDAQAQLRDVFPRLVGISKRYMPGYIEAFSRTYETDWTAYIAEASDQLRQATESIRRDREADQRRREHFHREPERSPQARLAVPGSPTHPANGINGSARTEPSPGRVS